MQIKKADFEVKSAFLRRERDSNPRYLSVRRFSRPVQSTTLPPLQIFLLSKEVVFPFWRCKGMTNMWTMQVFWRKNAIIFCIAVNPAVQRTLYLFFKGRIRGYFGGRAAQLAVGAVSGFMGAMFGTPGPPVVLYGMCVFKNKLEYMTTMQAFWVIFNIIYIVYRSGCGYYIEQTPVCWACGLSGAFVGTLLGAKCYSLLDAKSFRLVVYMVMAASGVVAFF